LDDPNLAELVSLEEDDSRMRIVPGGRDGTTNLTLVDEINSQASENLGLAPATYTRTITLVIGSGIATGTNLDDWLATAGLSGPNAEPDAIPFGDGVPNLLKFAFNMDAEGPDSSTLAPGGNAGLPIAGLDESGESTVWRVEFVRRKGSGLTYTPQISSTLEAGSFAPMTGTPTVTDIDEGWERVVVEEPCDPSITPRCFSRIEVVLSEN
jgi:hypothetical protein